MLFAVASGVTAVSPLLPAYPITSGLAAASQDFGRFSGIDVAWCFFAPNPADVDGYVEVVSGGRVYYRSPVQTSSSWWQRVNSWRLVKCEDNLSNFPVYRRRFVWSYIVRDHLPAHGVSLVWYWRRATVFGALSTAGRSVLYVS